MQEVAFSKPFKYLGKKLYKTDKKCWIIKVEKLPPLDIPRPNDVMDDFYIIASHELHASNTAATENHAKGLKGIEIYRKDIFDFKRALLLTSQKH